MTEKKTDHIQGEIKHVYDGIEEADNQLPLWLSVMFLLTTVFGLGYWIWYGIYAISPGPKEAYLIEMANAKTMAPADNALLESLSKQASFAEKGRELYTQNCLSCHGAKGEGGIGPNLTDGSWIHGGEPLEIYGTVKNGFVAKGMAAWGATLGEKNLRNVVAFVLTLRNTNVPGKPPEGPRPETPNP